jgi:hypothetical protein
MRYYELFGADQMMRPFSLAAWVLCALIVAACLDAVPDPPAIKPSKVEALSGILQSGHESLPQLRWSFGFQVTHEHLPVRCGVSTLLVMTRGLADCAVLTRQAADSSPPSPGA